MTPEQEHLETAKKLRAAVFDACAKILENEGYILNDTGLSKSYVKKHYIGSICCKSVYYMDLMGYYSMTKESLTRQNLHDRV